MSLVTASLTFDRAAIMRTAWADWREKSKHPAIYGHTFAKCLKRAWATAKLARENLRSRVPVMTEDERVAQIEARTAAMSVEGRAAFYGSIALTCSTDGRLPERRA